MASKLVALVLMFILIALAPSQIAWAQFFLGGGFRWSSIDCTSIIAGISNQSVADLNIACTANIREIIRACRNHGEQADPAKAEKFDITADPIESVGLGSGLKVDRQGKATSNVVITNKQIRDALGDLLNPAKVCPNKNWIVDFAVTKLDLVIELLSGASQPPNQDNTCSVVGVSMDPATACQALPGATCHQDECAYFHHATPSTPTLLRNEFVDTTVCQKPNLTFAAEAYDCLCDLDGSTDTGFTTCPSRLKSNITQ